jgi:beta-glucosidase
VDVSNEGKRDGDEVAQLYLERVSAPAHAPLRQLAGFCRVSLKPGQTERISFVVSDRQMSLVDESGRRILEPGKFRVSVGGRQPDSRSEELAGTVVLRAGFEVTGRRRELPA